MHIGSFIDAVTRRSKGTVAVSGALIAGALAFRWLVPAPALSTTLMIAAAVVAGLPVARAAGSSLASRHVSIELLVTIAAVGAAFIGEYWEAAAVTFLFDLGGYLEARTMARTRGVIKELLDLAPVKAVVVREERQIEVDANEVSPGETVIVRPGGKVPVDGRVEGGTSRIDESAITGESYPAAKESGSSVFAGTINQHGVLRVTASGVGTDTTLARIIRRVEEAQEAKAPTQRFMERFSRWYTPAIIVLAGGVMLFTGDIELALTVLVIGCPGALVISTPVSVVAGIGGAARRGILMKGGAHLEQSGRITAVALDKTGTLTEGRPEVVRTRVASSVALRGEPVAAGASTQVAPDGGPTEGEILRWAAIAESGSEHPLGEAIRRAVNDDYLPQADSAQAVPGRGIAAEYEGREILVGSPRFMNERGVADTRDLAAGSRGDGELAAEAGREQSAAGTEIMVAVDLRLIGSILVADPIRPDAREAVSSLYDNGVHRVVMLTGDNEQTARDVAGELGITDVYAGVLPEEKLERIEALREEGYVTAMVGDGINDAPALAAADVGIAMGAAGSDVAIETADIALMKDDLHLLARAVRRARATLRNIRQNVAIAVVTVAVLLAGVLLGQVHMAGGMLVHEASVMVVILNGMRLLRG